jgi:hypothetical protein
MRRPHAHALFLTLAATAATAPAQSALEPLWFDQLSGVTAQGGFVVGDGAGGVFLAGSGFGAIGGPSLGSSDAVLVRDDIDGRRLWERQFGSADSDRLDGLTVDGGGGAFVVGSTYGDLSGQSNGLQDAYIARFDAQGNLLWVRQEGTPGDDGFNGVAPDGAGGCIALGWSNRSWYGTHVGSGTDVVVVRFDANGSILWSLQLGTDREDGPQSITSDGAGGVFVAGWTLGVALPAPVMGSGPSWLVHIDSAGVLVSGLQYGTSSEQPTAIVSDGTGGVFVAGLTVLGGGGTVTGIDAFVSRFDVAWNRTWTGAITTPGLFTIPSSIDAAGPNEVVVAGTVNDGFFPPGSPGVLVSVDGFVARFDGAGSALSRDDIGGAEEDAVESVALDGDAGVWVGGLTSSPLGGSNPQFFDLFVARVGRIVGARYCAPAVANSTGQPGRIVVTGSDEAADDALSLIAQDLPSNTFGYFLTSRTTGLVPMAGGSQGTLCLGGSIGRYNRPGEVGATGGGSSFTLRLDLASTPSPTGAVAVLAGETWNYQGWYRDANPQVTSNFTDAVAVTFH